MREEAISSGGTLDPTPAASSVGPSSPALPPSMSVMERSHNGKTASISGGGSQVPWASLSNSATGSAFELSRPSCRPWERGDLLRRLATFKPLDWSGKPKAACSLSCAQRGWINSEADKITCESCGASLKFTVSPTMAPAEVECEGEMFAKQLDLGHKLNCPWKGNSCPESLAQFPPTPLSALIGGYKDRCDVLLQFDVLPIVASSAIEQMRISRGPLVDRFLSHLEGDVKTDAVQELESSRDMSFSLYYRAQKIISLCGWEPRWLPNIQDCEEHSAQSAREGNSFGPAMAYIRFSSDAGPSTKSHSASAKIGTGKQKLLTVESRSDSRCPLLDCSLCGSTVRVLDFMNVPRPARFASNNIDTPDTSKKMALMRGASAASGVGWVAVDDMEREQMEDRDEVATTAEGKSVTADVDLNLTMAGALSYGQTDRSGMPEHVHATDMGRDLVIGQPAGSEVGDRAASFESHGPSSRKRNLEVGGSSETRAQFIHPADSVEGTVIDRDGDEVTDSRQFSVGPSKRSCNWENFESQSSPYRRDSSGAGPSHSVGPDMYGEGTRTNLFRQGSDQLRRVPSTMDSTRASSVIAMDTIGHSAGDDSMESVENVPGDIDEANFPSSSTYGNLDMNETSELNNSNQAQQSICFQPAAEVGPGDMGVSSTNDGEEVFNAETVTAQARDRFSLGISGGSVSMCASHEAQIQGTDLYVHRADSVVGDVEPRVDDLENQGQTGESAPDPGIMDEIVPDDMNREDPHGDSQDMMSRSVERADSGSKVVGSTKAESVESGYETMKNEVAKSGKSSSTNNLPFADSEFAFTNELPKVESNYEQEVVAFDPIAHHNQFCPWVNGNVAAAGSIHSFTNTSEPSAFAGWQLTLDAIDTLRSLGHLPIQTMQSESAASLYKDDHKAPREKVRH